MFDLPPSFSSRRPGGRLGAGFLLLLFLILPLAFANPRNAATVLPRLVIGPEEIVLVSQVGQSYQFSASWVGTPPTGNPALVWNSSNPDQVKISSTGLATALVPNAFAVISVTTLNDTLHHPGYASFGIGAYRNNLIRLSKLWLKKTMTYPAGGFSPNFHLEYLVTNNFATRSLTTGQVVFFGNRQGIRLTYPAQVVSGGVRLVGDPPAFDEVYQELHISIDGAAMNRMGAPELKAAQALAANNLDEEPLCSLGASISLAEDSAFELDLSGGELRNLALVVSGAAGAGLEPQQISASVSCEKEWNVLPLGPPIPLAGFTLQTWVHASVSASISVSAPFPELTSPEAMLTVPFRAGIVFENGELQNVGEPEEPNFDYQLSSVTQGDGKSGITVEAAVAGSVGARFSIYPVGLIYEDLAIVHLDMATFELELARQFELPWAAFQTPLSPGYEGPTLEDSVTLSFTLISLETGDTVNFFLNLLGIDGITLTPPLPIPPLFERIYSHPQPQISIASPQVYVDTGGGLPGSTAVLAELPEWTHPILPNPIDRVEVWRHHEGDYLASRWATGLRHTYTASPNELGAWTFRAYAFNDSLGDLRDLFPMATPAAALDVLDSRPPLTIEPARIDLQTTLGSSATQTLTFRNPGTQSVVYDLASLATHPQLMVDAGGPFKLAAGAMRQHTFTLQCGASPAHHQGWGFALETSGRVDRFPATLDCSLLHFSPSQLRFSMDVGQSQTLEVAVNHSLTEAVAYSVIQGGGLDIDPASGRIEPNQTKILSVTTHCSAAGTFTRIAHFGIDETNLQQSLEATVICKEKGGDTWGDPHLSTFDQVKYDFQAKGEFVLARSESAGFEVQVRQQPMTGRPVTFNKAVAVRLGDHVIGFYADPAAGPALTLDGVGTEIAANTTLSLADGGTIERVVGGRRNQYILRPPSGTSYVRIRRGSDHFNLFVHGDPAIADWQGLLGSPDGNPHNDFRLRNGIQLSSPPSFTELYDCNQLACFAYDDPQGWLIRDPAESLFLYAPGQGPLDFAPAPGELYPPEPVSPADFPPAQVEAAEEICATAGIHVPALLATCALDILVTGDVELALAAVDVQQGATLPPPDPTAIVVQASSEYGPGWAARTLDGYFGECNTGEWATAGQATGWISFTFPEPIELTRMKLWDRACIEQVRGQITFSSDGQNDDLPPVNFLALENAGEHPTELVFSPRLVRRVKVHILQTDLPDGHPNPGLAEVSFNEP